MYRVAMLRLVPSPTPPLHAGLVQALSQVLPCCQHCHEIALYTEV